VKSIRLKVLVVSGGLLLGACSSAPKSVPALDSVNAAYQAASNNPAVRQHASLEISDAKDQLRMANELWENGAKPAEVEAQASVAQARIDFAESTAADREQVRLAEREELDQRQAALDAKAQQVEANQRETAALKYQLLELETRKTERGLQLTLEDESFEPAETDLKSAAFERVSKIAIFLKENPEKTILIEGHSDNVGDPDWGYDLSAGRAGEVAAALADSGISIRRIAIKAYGGAQPVADNSTIAGRMKNRRVEVIFPGTPESAAAKQGG